MRKRTKIILGSIIVLGILILITLFYASWQFSRCLITVQNYSGQEMIDITVASDNDEVLIGRIIPGAKKTVRVHPKDESSVHLWYTDSLGQKHKWDGGYIEPSGGYRTLLIVDENHEVLDKSTSWPR